MFLILIEGYRRAKLARSTNFLPASPDTLISDASSPLVNLFARFTSRLARPSRDENHRDGNFRESGREALDEFYARYRDATAADLHVGRGKFILA